MTHTQLLTVFHWPKFIHSLLHITARAAGKCNPAVHSERKGNGLAEKTHSLCNRDSSSCDHRPRFIQAETLGGSEENCLYKSL